MFIMVVFVLSASRSAFCKSPFTLNSKQLSQQILMKTPTPLKEPKNREAKNKTPRRQFCGALRLLIGHEEVSLKSRFP